MGVALDGARLEADHKLARSAPLATWREGEAGYYVAPYLTTKSWRSGVHDKKWRVVVAADAAGLDYKEAIKADLLEDPRVSEVIDVGVSTGDDVDYPHVAVAGARKVASGEADRGVFVCGTGMGVAIAANKVPGVRASVAHDSFSVERLVLSNNGQVLALGQRVVGKELARRLAKEFLSYTFDPESASRSKVEAIDEYEAQNSQDCTCGSSCTC